MSETIDVNGERRLLEDRLLVDLLRRQGIDPGRQGIAVAVDGAVVPRGEWATRELRGGEQVEIVGAVQGG